jgi:hypothetical protein
MNKIYILLFLLSSCASYEQFRQITDELEVPSEVYPVDFNLAWKAVISVMSRYDSIPNQEIGQIKTRWMDNTLEVNFSDSFGSADAVKQAEQMIIVNVAEGFSYGKKVTKVSVFKRQRIERDFLQGKKEIATDGILEKTILYRIRTVINNDIKIREIDQAREKEQLENF